MEVSYLQLIACFVFNQQQKIITFQTNRSTPCRAINHVLETARVETLAGLMAPLVRTHAHSSVMTSSNVSASYSWRHRNGTAISSFCRASKLLQKTEPRCTTSSVNVSVGFEWIDYVVDFEAADRFNCVSSRLGWFFLSIWRRIY